MYDNLGDLVKNFPIGTKIRISEKRDDYVQGKFVVDGYLYTKEDKWYPAHRMANGEWEIYEEN